MEASSKPTLPELGKIVGIPRLTDIAAKLFAKAGQLAKRPTDPLLNYHFELHINEINKINRNIEALYDDDSRVFVTVRTADDREEVDSIQNIYTSYLGAIESQHSPVVLGQQSVQKVCRGLEQIHTSLIASGESSLLAKAINESRRGDSDILTHYVATRQFMLNYATVQLQGLVLLTLVSKNPPDSRTDVRPWIEKVQSNLEAQERAFAPFFGQINEQMAKRIMADRSAALHVVLISLSTKSSVDPMNDPRYTHTMQSNKPTFCTLRAHNPIDPNQEQDKIAYKFDILGRFDTRNITQKKLVPYSVAGSPTRVKMTVPENEESGAGWRLNPTKEDGVFRLEYRKGGWYQRQFLSAENALKDDQNRDPWLEIRSADPQEDKAGHFRIFYALEDYKIGPHVLGSWQKPLQQGVVLVSPNGKWFFGLEAEGGRPEITESSNLNDTKWSADGFFSYWRGKDPNICCWLEMRDDGSFAAHTPTNSAIYWQTPRHSTGFVRFSNSYYARLNDDAVLEVLTAGHVVIWPSKGPQK